MKTVELRVELPEEVARSAETRHSRADRQGEPMRAIISPPVVAS